MTFDLLRIVLGLGLLLLAGDVLVRGAVNAALRLGVPALIVSLTVVAFGTSAPELLVSIRALQDGAPGIALGNVVGSNIANVLLVLGVPALISGIAVNWGARKSYAMMLGVTAVFIAGAFLGPIGPLHGALYLAILAAILWDQGREAMMHRSSPVAVELEELEGADPEMRWWKILLFLALGLVGLPLGSDLLVDGAVAIATVLGVSDAVIGLTLVAVGTSLPELATTVVAAIRRQADVALGNVIGSNIFNLLAIIGIASFVAPIPVAETFLRFDLWVMAASSALLALFFGTSGRNMTKRWGALFLGSYAVYLVAVVVMGGTG